MKMIEGSFLETTKYIKRRIKTICYYFTLAYVDDDSVRFTEIDRFKEQSCAECAPFKNDYVGYAIIDLTEWADKPVNSKLKAFLYYLIDRELSNSKNKVIFFSEKETGTVLNVMWHVRQAEYDRTSEHNSWHTGTVIYTYGLAV